LFDEKKQIQKSHATVPFWADFVDGVCLTNVASLETQKNSMGRVSSGIYTSSLPGIFTVAEISSMV